VYLAAFSAMLAGTGGIFSRIKASLGLIVASCENDSAYNSRGKPEV
jgi:hypothetical protein